MCSGYIIGKFGNQRLKVIWSKPQKPKKKAISEALDDFVFLFRISSKNKMIYVFPNFVLT